MADDGQENGRNPPAGRPQMCPSCRKLIGVERICPYCGANARSPVNRARGTPDEPPVISVTGLLVVVNLLFFALTLALGGSGSGSELLSPNHDILMSLGLQDPDLVASGEWWRLVLPIFLHLGLLHLVMNTLVLWATGRHLERDIGGAAFFFMYIAAGTMGFVASQFAHIGGGGASGAVAGILGCTIVKRRLSDGHFQHPVTMQAIQLVLLNALFGLAISKVNNTAHLGGLLTGAALGIPFARFEGRRVARRLWLAGAALSGGLVLAAVAALIVTPPQPGAGILQSGWLCAQKGRAALVASGEAVMRGPAVDAVRCFEGLVPMGEEVDPTLAAMRKGLALSVAGDREGSMVKQREGAMAFQEAFLDFARWLEGRGYLQSRLPEPSDGRR